MQDLNLTPEAYETINRAKKVAIVVGGVSFGISHIAAVYLYKFYEKKSQDQTDIMKRMQKFSEHLAHILDRNDIEIEEFDRIVMSDLADEVRRIAKDKDEE